MDFRLMRMRVNGIKNISKPLTISFLGETISSSKNISGSNVKAIFGPNGSGKSAIVNAVCIYKELTTKYGYFIDEDNLTITNELINKKNKKFDITMDYAVINKKKILLAISHRIILDSNEGRPFIERELIEEYTEKTLNQNKNTIFDIKKGIIDADFNVNNEIDKTIMTGISAIDGISSAISLTNNISFLNKVQKMIEKSDGKELIENSKLLVYLLFLTSCGNNINVFLENSDMHNLHTQKTIEELLETLQIPTDDEDVNINDEIIEKKLFSDYEKKVKKLKTFITLFKPELKDIIIKKKSEASKYHIVKEFVYDDYSIDEEYESTGIKRLVRMYSSLESVAKGGIAFIDEMDANISDGVLNQLIDFFINYADGQLIFTTHNSYAMESVKKVRHGLDFINYDNDVITWIRSGNTSPIKKYREGMVPGIVYNTEDFDFIKCFSVGE